MGSSLTRLVAPGLQALGSLDDRVYVCTLVEGQARHYLTAQERHKREDDAGHCRDDRSNYQETRREEDGRET